VDGADKLDAIRLHDLSDAPDVFDEEPDDRFRGEVGVLGVRGAEDLRLAAVRKLEDRELAFFVIEGETQGIPVKSHHLLVVLGTSADPSQALDECVHRFLPSNISYWCSGSLARFPQLRVTRKVPASCHPQKLRAALAKTRSPHYGEVAFPEVRIYQDQPSSLPRCLSEKGLAFEA
jgi:hypothetical protein